MNCSEEHLWRSLPPGRGVGSETATMARMGKAGDGDLIRA